MKRFVVLFGVLFASCLAQAATAAASSTASEPSPYLLVLAGVALIGTIVHRRNKAKSRT